MTFCLDGSYCCGNNNNTACCNTDNANLEIFYNNPATIPLASASLSDYYSGLRLSTQRRSKFLSTSSSSSIQDLGTTSSGSQTALTPSSAARIVSSTSRTASSTTSSTTSSTNFLRLSSSQSFNRPSGLCQSGKIAIEVAVPIVTILMAAFATWKILRRRRRGKPGMIIEGNEQHLTYTSVPDQQSATSELPSGFDRAELVTKHWDSVELPARGAPAELGGHTRDCDLKKRLE